ncbi:hypothetical protein [Methylocapsa sp. S129]|uniref:hypothetical protein n=1 Tax=Methylocapsa sp. S129 TaxID=1641869 RepID=UPI00131B99F9|nr:hypothetical protein [Methylocapsa sp. S129]
MRLLCAAMLLSALGMGEALAEDNGERLFQIFERTCAMKPVSGEALDAQARSLGYIHQDGPVAPDDLKRDPDDINFWKLSDQGSNFAIDAYFGGPRAHYQVSCSVHADNVDPAAFIERLKRETTLPDPQTKSDPETGKLTYAWTAEADGGKDRLEVAAFRNGRVLVAFSYDVIAR